MNKRDIVLAQKAIAARQVKEEQKAIKALLQQSKRHAKSTPDLSRSLDSSLNPFRTSNYAGSLDRTCSTPALPDIYQHQQMSSPSSNMKHCSSPRISSPIPSSNSNDSGRRAQQSSRTGHQRVSLYNEKIAQELSKRAVT